MPKFKVMSTLLSTQTVASTILQADEISMAGLNCSVKLNHYLSIVAVDALGALNKKFVIIGADMTEGNKL